jgi:GrpB-like predicted nucleotidyltransferase (UPF0157 family)
VTFSDDGASHATVVSYDPAWPNEFDALASRIKDALGPLALSIDHIGSTAIPGLVAKDCIDIQVRVDHINEEMVVPLFDAIGFRKRPEMSNRFEITGGRPSPTLVFAPPVDERPSHVHVRAAKSDVARRDLLLRDFLRADETARLAWNAFKRRLTQTAVDVYEYDQLKAAATDVAMIAAEYWALQADWMGTG